MNGKMEGSLHRLFTKRCATILRFFDSTTRFYSSLISQRAYTPLPLSLETFDNQSDRKESFPGIAL